MKGSLCFFPRELAISTDLHTFKTACAIGRSQEISKNSGIQCWKAVTVMRYLQGTWDARSDYSNLLTAQI